MSRSRQHELQARIGPQITIPNAGDTLNPAFDPENMAVARARENFEKAGKAWPRASDDSVSASRGGGGLVLDRNSSHATNKLEISSDSSMDEVLEEAEREAQRWEGRHKHKNGGQEHEAVRGAHSRDDAGDRDGGHYSTAMRKGKGRASYSTPTPPSSPARPMPNAALQELQDRLRRFYDKITPQDHPDPAQVAHMYIGDLPGLNAALLSKYGTTLYDVGGGMGAGGAEGGAQGGDEGGAGSGLLKARRRKVMELLQDDSPLKLGAAPATATAKGATARLAQRRALQEPVLLPLRTQGTPPSSHSPSSSPSSPPETNTSQRSRLSIQRSNPTAASEGAAPAASGKTWVGEVDTTSSGSDSDFYGLE